MESKISAHYWLNRILTEDEFFKLKNIKSELKFKRGEKVFNKIFYKYSRQYKNGLCLVTEDCYIRDKIKRVEYEKRKTITGGEEFIKKKRLAAKRSKLRPEYIEREKLRKNSSEYKEKSRLRYKNNENFRISKKLRKRIRKVTKSTVLYARSMDADTINFLKWYKVKHDLRAEEYHIDHIFPLFMLDLSIKEVQVFANSVDNVRWVKKAENLSKSSKLPSYEIIETHKKDIKEWKESRGNLLAELLEGVG